MEIKWELTLLLLFAIIKNVTGWWGQDYWNGRYGRYGYVTFFFLGLPVHNLERARQLETKKGTFSAFISQKRTVFIMNFHILRRLNWHEKLSGFLNGMFN